MSKNKGRIAAAISTIAVVATAVGLSVLGGATADAAQSVQPRTAAAVISPDNSCGSPCIINNSVGQADIYTGTWSYLNGWRDANSIWSFNLNKSVVSNDKIAPSAVTSDKIASKAVTSDDLADEVNARIDDRGPAYLKHWGIISRNVIGNASAATATTSTEAPAGDGALHIHTSSAADKTAFGNEVDFAGKNVKDLGTVGFSVYTTGENSALGNNMPSITFEIDPNVDGNAANYSSLVYVPANSASNAWTAINATTDEGKHWGLTGSAFNGTACSINGARCTWAEVLAYLNDGGDDAKVLTAGISKGRDYAGDFDVDLLKVDGKTYDFEPAGVLAN